ncbi:vacuolar protein sorting/targeting protein 10 [Lentinula aff. detonsa]|uniref:Vacuolar protein sorting/targeting protein 10 n=1 Tax=Lentinula aff. detonsa TaxID=2804958 RepID=A0AA38NIQ7_9AGAR|nr:vacuolar protein sorting/targeting protein 10 [Lentinula aff. detonsa]
MILRALWLSLASLSILAVQVVAQDPSHQITSFENLPGKLVFLEDTTTAFYLDDFEGNLFITQDEGKSWSSADTIPAGDAAMVIEHPFEKNYAFVLTRGYTHYRTEDRGKTWRSFDMPVRPAFVAQPLSFHSDPKKYGYILYQGTACDEVGWGAVCHDETYYTKEAFSDEPMLLLSETTRCQFAHSTVDFKHEAHSDLIYCVAFDTLEGIHSLSHSRLYSTTTFFDEDMIVEDLGIGSKNARGVFAFAIVAKYAVVALKDMSADSNGEMLLYVTVDTKTWAKAQFPHASSARLRENAYTIVESTTHSLAVDVVLQDQGTIGTLFVSNSNGTFFVQSLKDTNRNEMGFVDFEKLYGVDGVGIANVVANAEEVEGRGASKLLKSVTTFDDGSNWSPLLPPSYDSDGSRINCNPGDDDCALHLWSVTAPHNFGRIFSSPAPGIVMGVGSIGKTLLPYEDCDTFLSTDAGLTWKMVRKDAHKYEFGDSGSVVMAINDEDGVDNIIYSLDMGETWKTYNIGLKLRARALSTVPDSTSQKFLLVGQVSRKDENYNKYGRYVVVFLDFAGIRNRKCEENDFERWYARSGKSECLMGHKQWYRRRKSTADCYVGDKFIDPVQHEDNCECTDADYECDFNFVRDGNDCVPVGPEPIPAGVCTLPSQKYMGSSGWRKIPGNTCTGGRKDEKVEKDCSNAQPKEGEIIHQTFEFPSQIVQHAYFRKHPTILVRLHDNSIWQSSNEGYTWSQLFPDENFLAFYHHPHSSDRAYLITSESYFYSTTDAGRSWNKWNAPAPPNTFRAQVIRFQPEADRLIWTGNLQCNTGLFEDCHATAWYTRDHGRSWKKIEDYVVNCAWASDTKLNADPTEILCESYQRKEGNQRFFLQDNPLELIEGQGYYSKKKKLFNQVVGFAKFSEFLVVAELASSGRALELQVSLDGVNFATGEFPPSMHPETHAYTVLESSTGSLFIHMTMSEPPSPYWGTILKSNSNGTYFVVSQDLVNRDERGYVDFEKMIGLDGIALINIIANPFDAMLSGRKMIASRITHNDGSTWKPLKPPTVDSEGNSYWCDTTACSLHVHGYTERRDPRATYSSPSIVGLIMAVGNVGEVLAPYTDSDTFLSRDAGFTWEEVHKDAHLWEFGDSGSILIMANDEEPTDHVLFSTDEGAKWREYKFTNEKIRVTAIVTVPSDTSRRFILMGQYPSKQAESVVVHIDFSALTGRQCVLKVEDPTHDDFELWSPSEDRNELCLFGRQTLYHRRIRNTNCYIGDQAKEEARIQNNCACSTVDFECEFNYIKNANDECVLAPGTTPLLNDETCRAGEEFWYERTPYRKISYSSCDGGHRPDRGKPHPCPGFKHHSGWFWWFVILISFGLAGLVGLYFYRRSGVARGNIRLPTDLRSNRALEGDSGILSTLASVPWFLVGLAGIAWEYVASNVESLSNSFRNRRGYRNLPADEDAQILRFEDEE